MQRDLCLHAVVGRCAWIALSRSPPALFLSNAALILGFCPLIPEQYHIFIPLFLVPKSTPGQTTFSSMDGYTQAISSPEDFNRSLWLQEIWTACWFP